MEHSTTYSVIRPSSRSSMCFTVAAIDRRSVLLLENLSDLDQVAVNVSKCRDWLGFQVSETVLWAKFRYRASALGSPVTEPHVLMWLLGLYAFLAG